MSIHTLCDRLPYPDLARYPHEDTPELDPLPVALRRDLLAGFCRILTWCRTTRLKGRAALEAYEAGRPTMLCKYNDPIEGAREDLTPEEAEAIAREDPALVYCDVSCDDAPDAEPVTERTPQADSDIALYDTEEHDYWPLFRGKNGTRVDFMVDADPEDNHHHPTLGRASYDRSVLRRTPEPAPLRDCLGNEGSDDPPCPEPAIDVRVLHDADIPLCATHLAEWDEDPPRTWTFHGDGGEGHEPVVSTLADLDLADVARDGDWDIDARDGSIAVHVIARCAATDDEISQLIILDPDEPRCIVESGHDWSDDHRLVGGDERNPGVWSNGAGIRSHYVCTLCGIERVESTCSQGDGASTEDDHDSVCYPCFIPIEELVAYHGGVRPDALADMDLRGTWSRTRDVYHAYPEEP